MDINQLNKKYGSAGGGSMDIDTFVSKYGTKDYVSSYQAQKKKKQLLDQQLEEQRLSNDQNSMRELDIQEMTPTQPKPVDQIEHEKKTTFKEGLVGQVQTINRGLFEGIKSTGTGLKSFGREVEANRQSGSMGTPDLIMPTGLSKVPGVGKAISWAGYKLEGTGQFLKDKVLNEAKIPQEYTDSLIKESGIVNPLLRPDIYLAKFNEVVGGMAPAIGASIATKSPAPMMAIMGFQEKGSAFDDYIESTARERGVDVSQLMREDVERADILSTFYGIGSALLETAPFIKFVKKVGGKEAAKSVLSRVIKDVPLQMLEEGATEGGQQFFQNLLAVGAGIDERDLTEGVAESALVGAVVGGPVGVVQSLRGGGEANMPQVPPEEPPKEPEKKFPEYNKNKKVEDIIIALQDDDTSFVEENIPKLSKDELQNVYTVLDQASKIGASAEVEADRQYIKDILDQKEDAIKEVSGEIIAKKTTTELENPIEEMNPEDIKYVEDNLKQVKERTGEELPEIEKSDELPVLRDYKEYLNEENPFSQSITEDEINESWDQQTTKLNEDINSEVARKNELLAKKKESADSLNKKAIQSQIDFIDKGIREMNDKKNALENQAVASKLKLVQDTVNEIKKIEPNFDLQDTLDNNWTGEDYNLYLSELNKNNDKTRDNTGTEKVAERVPDVQKDVVRKDEKEEAKDPLIEEARKYKSAEEFVEAQGDTLYHGTNTKFNKFDVNKIGSVQPTDWGNGFYFTNSKKAAKSYAKVSGGNIVMEVKTPGIKYADESIIRNDSKFWNSLDDGMNDTALQDYLDSKGFDGLKVKNKSGHYEYIVFNPEKIKTKSQLTDIWNKANTPPKTQTPLKTQPRANKDPLIEEAKKGYTRMETTLKNGKKVSFDYSQDQFGVAHIEFHSKEVSETGYRSHFFNKSELEGTTIEKYANDAAQFFADEVNKQSSKNSTNSKKSDNIIKNNQQKNGINQNPRQRDKSGKLPSPVQVGESKSGGVSEPTEVNVGKEQGISGNVNGESGKRYENGQRLGKNEIEELVKSKSKFSEEEKNILRTYEGSGGTKEGEGRGVLDEFFTPQEIVDKIWGLVNQNLTDIDNIAVLEPSAGTGRFIESAPAGADITAYEINPISAKISKVLNPGVKVINKPFEDMFMDEKGGKKKFEVKYDVVIGNPPYGIHRGMYKGLGEEKKIGRYEEYFMKRSLDVTKDGGIVAMIIPSGFLRGGFDYAKGQIAMRGDLIDAYRLPNKSFSNTDIGTDIVIIKKNDKLASGEQIKGDIWSHDGFFKENPEKVLGQEVEKSGRFGKVKAIEGELKIALDKIETVDIEQTQKDAVQEIVEKIDAIELEQPMTEAVKKRTIKKAVETARKKTKLQKKGDNNKLYERDPKQPYKLTSVKAGGTKIFQQGENEEAEYFDRTLEDGSIDPKTISELSKSELSKLNYQRGKYYNDFNYLQGDIYKKLGKLDADHIQKRISQEQYNKQKAKLENIVPKRIGIESITLLPIDNLANEIKVDYTDSYGDKTEVSLADAFKMWLRGLPYSAMEGSSPYEIGRYIDGIAVRGGTKEQNIKEKNRRRKIGNKLFKKFYTEEIDDKAKSKIEDIFNEKYNNFHRPDYTKYPLKIELNEKFYDEEFNLRDIQKEGAAFLVNKGVGLLGYEVGVGKTLTAIAAISEVMNRGWTKKPLIVVPKNLKSKWIEDLMQSMPDIKINDLDNLGGRFKFKGDLTSLDIEEGSISVITEDGFKRIGYSEETYKKLTDNLKDVTYKLGDKSKRDRQLESSKTEELEGKARKGTSFPKTFEELGFDHITIDEAHRGKNIFSSAQASKGDRKANEYGALRGAVSERGLKTYLACQYILSNNGGRNVFLLTATPFNNQPIEVYSILSLMAKNRLEQLGISNVNDFISMFCELESKFAIKANGDVQMTDQVRKYNNLGQLQKLVREFMDVRTGEEAGVKRPSKQKFTPYIKMSQLQADLIIKAQELFNSKDGGVLQAITELQKITLSPYLSQYNRSSYTPEDLVNNSPKIKYVVEAIKSVHKTNPNAGQIIFSEKGIEVFRGIKEYFINNGYKANEVAIIDSSVSNDAKDDIQDRFQNGEIKILLASGTVKEGVDLQRYSTDLYNLFLQWNPTDMIQAEGRTWRQGSYYDNVRIHYPLLENSVDPFIFQKLEEKASRISDIFSYKGDSLDVSDIDFEGMKFELITDPVKRVEAEEVFVRAEQQSKLKVAEAELAFIERRVEKLNELENSIKNYTEYKEQAKKRDDASDVNYYAEKIVKAYKELGDEKEKLKNKGVKVDEIQKEIEIKKKEVEAIETKLSSMYKEFEKKVEEAKKQSVNIVIEENKYEELTEQFSDKNFFTHEGEVSLELPNKLYSLINKSDAELSKIVNDKEFEEAMSEVLSEVNPVLRERIMRKGMLKIVNKLENAFGQFDTETGEISIARDLPDKYHVKRTFRHEIFHLAFGYLTDGEKSRLLKFFKFADEKTKAEFFGIDGNTGKSMYYAYKERYGKQQLALSEEAVVLQSEARNANKLVRKIRLIMEKLIKFLHRVFGLFKNRVLGIEARKMLDEVFDKNSTFFNDRKFIPRSKRILFSLDTRKSGEVKTTEKRKVYMEAFNQVFGENKPPSLGKMIEENFKEKERRTLIKAEKLEAVGLKTFNTAFSEGKQVGYLKGQVEAITKTEKSMNELKEKLEKSEYKNQEQKTIMEVKLDELNTKHREQKDELIAKIEKQAGRFKAQKERLREKLRLKMVDYHQIRKEMVVYIKDNLPRKSWNKFLIAVRDGKTTKNLEKVVRKVDEEVNALQRSEAVKNIKRIIKNADQLPIEAQMMIKNITDGINWQGALPKTIAKLERINNYLKNRPEAKLSMPMRILRKLGILEKTNLKDLTTEQLIAINGRLERIKKVGRAVVKDRKVLKVIQRNKKLDRLMTESLNYDWFSQSGNTAEEREKIASWRRTLDKIQTVDWQVMPIDQFLTKLDKGLDNGANYEIIKKPVDIGFNEYWKLSKEVKDRLWEFLSELKKKHTITEKEWERIGIYAIREQKGGKAKLRGSGYTKEQIESVVLSEEETAIYGFMRKELDALFPMIKQVYETVYQKELPGVENYFPFIMDWGNREPIYQEFEEQFNFNKGTEKGFTIKRKGGFNPVKINALEVFIDHLDKATYFIALEPAVKEIRDIVKSHRYAEAVGEKAQSYVMKWVELIERHGQPKDPADNRIIDAMRKNVTFGVLAYKLTTIPIQFTAILPAMAEIGHYAVTGFNEYIISPKARKFILTASQQMVNRIGDDPIYNEMSPNRLVQGIKEVGMWGIKKTDMATAAGVWLGAYRQFLDNHGIEFSYDNISQEAVLYADKIVRKTQATADYKDLPPILVQRARSMGKLLLQFQNYTLFLHGYLRGDVVRNLSKKPIKASWQVTMITLNMVAGLMLRELIARGIYGDDKEEDEESMVSKIAWQYAQLVPFLGNMVYGAHSVVKYKSTENVLSGIPVVDTFIKGGRALSRAYSTETPEIRSKYAVQAISFGATLLGFPAATQLGQIAGRFVPEPPKSGGRYGKYKRYGN